MSADGMSTGMEADLQGALLAVLRTDAALQSSLGSPARIFDAETESPVFPCIELERHEVRPRGASGADGEAHTLSFGLRSRSGGRAEAMRLLGGLRRAVERARPGLAGQRIVLIQPVYADVMRTPDLREFRGILRVRIITEEAV